MVGFTDLAIKLQELGVMDFLLPFILGFTIVVAIMRQTKILGVNDKFRIVIALVLALLFVIPHITGAYPAGYDPVQIINESLPSVALVSVAVIMLLLLMGLFGAGFGEPAKPVLAIIAIIFIVYIFGSSLNIWQGPSDVFTWWTDETTELMLIFLVAGVILYFITRKSGEGMKLGDAAGKFWDGLTKMFKKS